ncbi:MAG: peptidoglycan editing factor PgeF [Neisseriaceae bacterium]
MNNRVIIPNWNKPTKVKVLITTRNGGVSMGAYRSFNLAAHVDDDPTLVLQNRKILSQYLPSEPIWLKQTHSTNILNLIDNIDNIKINLENEYDGIITNNKSQVAVVMTADCIPLLLTDKHGTFVGAIHAGWRGLANGIVDNVLTQINVIKKDILAYIGPTICKHHFEVGHDVYQLFNLSFNYDKYFVSHNNGKFLCDLPSIIKEQLINNGILEENITNSNLCTYCKSDLFFSHRRDKVTGRIASLIWLV